MTPTWRYNQYNLVETIFKWDAELLLIIIGQVAEFLKNWNILNIIFISGAIFNYLEKVIFFLT